MKKFTKLCLTLVMLFAVCLALTGCSKITQEKADEIQSMIDEGEKLTVSEVEKILGDATKKSLLYGNGWVIFSKLSEEEWNEALENGEKVDYITVAFLGSNAVSASFTSGAAEEE